MAFKVEDVDHAFPDGLTLEGLADGNGLDKRGTAGMCLFDRYS
jgi:hypothetical protein